MAEVSATSKAPAAADMDRMHDFYRQGGRERAMAPHVVYPEANCPHPGCTQALQAIDFRLGDHGRDVHDPLVRAWWDDTGFAGRCPRCGGWIHFTIRSKRAITPDAAARLPQPPDDWHAGATIL
ncbi:MAG TPA: hypothetical protein VG406_28720 [Isosphaeraceae bacterium]|jgi:hypothetical protein|nr:hypothetical protein [Isosphaeraceae bacterium]